METLGERIKTVLASKGIRRKQLRVGQGSLSDVINGNKRASADWLRNLAREMDVTFEELTKDTDFTIPPNAGPDLYCPNPNCAGAVWDGSATEQDRTPAGKDGRSRGREFRSFNRLPRVDRHGNVRKFCNDCGSKLVDTDPMPACPRCKRPAESSRQTFCNGCGQDFRALRFVAAELEVKAENMKITGPGPNDFEFYIPLLAHPPKLTSLPPGAILGDIDVHADDQSVTFFLIAPRSDPRPLQSPVKDFEDCTRPFQRLLQVGKDGRDV